MSIEDLVKINPFGGEAAGSSRVGTAYCNMDELEIAIGRQHSDGDGYKVSAVWYFETPRGRAALRDYYSNGAGVWSIAAADSRAGMWLAKYLRSLKIKAIGKRNFELETRHYG